MGQTLTHGVYLPDEGERNCYSGLAANWQLLDGAVGTIAEHSTQIAGKANAVHTHTKADITDFPAYGNSAGTICEGNDSRLSDARTPLSHTHTKSDITDFPALANVATSGSYNDLSNIPASFTPASHTHGNLTNDGKVGTTANQPLITGTGGVVQAGSFGNAANTFCEGNDSRLSDARTPVAHTHGKADITDLFNSANTWTNEQTCGSNSPKWVNKNNNLTIGIAPASNQTCAFYNYDKDGNEIGRLISRVQPDGKTLTWVSAANLYKNGAIDPTGSPVWANLYCAVDANGYPHVSTDCDLTPNVNNTYNLGTSTNKWKTLNGINPGALSLPDISGADPIDFSQWDVSGAAWTNYYTPSENGWLRITINDRATNSIYVVNSNDISSSAYGNGSQITGGTGRLVLFMPVRSGVRYQIIIKANSISDVGKAEFIPCSGNV